MVNAQEHLNQNFQTSASEIKVKDAKLEGIIDLSKYTNLKEISLINCGLNSFDFLNTVSDKEKIVKLDLGHNPIDKYQKELVRISQFTNLEWVSLFDIRGSEVYLKPLYWLSKAKTFLIHDDIGGGWEYTPDSLTKLYLDDKHNKQYLEWRKKHHWVIKIAHQEAQLERKLSQKTQEHKEKTSQLSELSTLIFSNQSYNFSQLKQEIIRLKYQELAPQIRDKRTELEQLITNTKNKVETNFTGIIDLLLESQKQIKEQNNDLIQGQLIAYKTILETKLTQEELQTLLNKQTELCQLEKHLENLQRNQGQTAQILQTNLPSSSQGGNH